MSEFDPSSEQDIREYVTQAIADVEADQKSRAWELAKKVSPPLRVGSFALRNWGVLLGLVVGGGATVASVADMIRIPPEKSVTAEGSVQAIWSVTEIDISLTDSFADGTAEDDTLAFDPSALVMGMPRTVMKYTPERGRYISYETVEDPILGSYVLIAEYDSHGNKYGLNYDDPLFHTLLAEECDLEILDGKMEPDSSCTDPDDPNYRGIVDHDLIYTGYPGFDDLSIVGDAEVAYSAASGGARNCIARMFFGGLEVVHNTDGTVTYTEQPVIAYHNIRSAIKANLIADFVSSTGMPVFDERGIRRVLFPDDVERLKEAARIFGADNLATASATELQQIFSLDIAPLPVEVELHEFDMGKTTGEILLELKKSVPEIYLPEGLSDETALTHSVNAGCVPASEDAQRHRIENHEFSMRYGAEMVGTPYGTIDGGVMTAEEAKAAFERVLGSQS